MKKVFTTLVLLLACAAMSYADQKVYFTPNDNWALENARFALYMFTDETTNAWTDFSYNTTLGVYEASFDETYTGGMIICRMNPDASENNWNDGVKWNQSGNLDVPTAPVYYTMSGADWNAYTFNGTTITVGTTYHLAAEHDIAKNYEGWATSGTTNQMTESTSMFYTISVTGNALNAGTYNYKIVRDGNNWLGDLENWGDNFKLVIAESGTYDIDYTYNLVTGKATATATRKGDATITYKYHVWVDGGSIISGAWDAAANEMAVDEGTASLTYNNKALAAQTYEYKVIKTAYNSDVKMYDSWIGQPGGANMELVIAKASTYNVTFSYDISTMTPSATAVEQFIGYYLVGGTGEWAVGDALTNTDGVYSIEIPYVSGYSFAIVPNTAIGSDNAVTSEGWATVIRPASQQEVKFQTANGTTTSGEGLEQNWKMYTLGSGETNAFNATFTYNKEANTWAIAAAAEVKLNSDGYATYSNANMYKVSGVTANFVTVSGSVATLAPQSAEAVFPAGSGKNNGIILSGAAGAKATITAVADGDTPITATSNLLAGSGNYSYGITGDFGSDPYTAYIFGKKKETIGFYKVDDSGNSLAAHKAFLAVPTTVGAPNFIGFDFSNPTAIESIEVAKEGVKNAYNLAGQRVANPTKGLYIVNGRKVVLK